MRKSTTAITLTLLGPALLAAGCARNCDPAIEDCTSRSSSGRSGFFIGSGSRGGSSGSSFSGTSRGGFGSTGGAGHAGGFGAGG